MGQGKVESLNSHKRSFDYSLFSNGATDETMITEQLDYRSLVAVPEAR